jgi:glucoamylase
VGVEFLELVRRGLRRPDDPRILASRATVDATLRASLPWGPAWRRYDGDRYGESDDGRPWAPWRQGRGRPWPLLSGERAHHALANGEPVADFILAIEACAGPELILPEQVWDGPDLPACALFAGRATGSAAPLGWAHAEYLKLLIAFATSRIPDVVDVARQRYALRPPPRPSVVWSSVHRLDALPQGRGFRVQLDRRGDVVWALGPSVPTAEVPGQDTRLGLWVADLPLQRLAAGARVHWTVRYADGGWDPEDHELAILPAEPAGT